MLNWHGSKNVKSFHFIGKAKDSVLPMNSVEVIRVGISFLLKHNHYSNALRIYIFQITREDKKKKKRRENKVFV